MLNCRSANAEARPVTWRRRRTFSVLRRSLGSGLARQGVIALGYCRIGVPYPEALPQDVGPHQCGIEMHHLATRDPCGHTRLHGADKHGAEPTGAPPLANRVRLKWSRWPARPRRRFPGACDRADERFLPKQRAKLGARSRLLSFTLLRPLSRDALRRV